MSTAIAPETDRIGGHRPTHLRQLEAESIYILREVPTDQWPVERCLDAIQQWLLPRFAQPAN